MDEMGDPQELEQGEQAFIYLTTDMFPEFTQYKKLPLDESSSSDEDRLDLAVGNIPYHLDILLIDGNDTLIGGYRGNWTPDQDALELSNTITLYGIEPMPKASSEDEQASLFIALENTTIQEQIQPTFS